MSSEEEEENICNISIIGGRLNGSKCQQLKTSCSHHKKEKKKVRRGGYLKNKEEARKVILEDLERINKFYGFKYNKVSIRDQSTRWGSCSSNSNLNFNFQLLFVTPEEREYVVVHELCHLKEMNHSKNFWNLVAKAFPNYKTIRAQLKSRKILSEF